MVTSRIRHDSIMSTTSFSQFMRHVLRNYIFDTDFKNKARQHLERNSSFYQCVRYIIWNNFFDAVVKQIIQVDHKVSLMKATLSDGNDIENQS